MKKILSVLILMSQPCAWAEAGDASLWTLADNVPWAMSEGFSATRWKDLVGGDNAGQIPQDDLRFGLFQLAPNAVYPGHRHGAPEVYYVLSGKARWTVGSESFKVESGTTVYVPANTVHRMINLSEEPLTAVWAWWAPGGDQSVFDKDAYEFTESIPDQTAVGFEGNKICASDQRASDEPGREPICTDSDAVDSLNKH